MLSTSLSSSSRRAVAGVGLVTSAVDRAIPHAKVHHSRHKLGHLKRSCSAWLPPFAVMSGTSSWPSAARAVEATVAAAAPSASTAKFRPANIVADGIMTQAADYLGRRAGATLSVGSTSGVQPKRLMAWCTYSRKYGQAFTCRFTLVKISRNPSAGSSSLL